MHSALCRSALALALSLCASPVAADERPPPAMDALGVLADLTLIDGACKNVVVNFGVGFRFAAARGLPEAAIMPGGARRADFETVLRMRRATFDGDELCGEIARNYVEALPASVVPLYGHADPRP